VVEVVCDCVGVERDEFRDSLHASTFAKLQAGALRFLIVALREK